ncbi:MAG: hypothetical protein BGO26_07940 [Actinobacteria bacterium 69-20]|nr:peroxide stress protein YaaA [Actinomycetota bacterium]OJV30261.1 MAG: hypothetical protein BGO26_07940 [Actinobacteria bacterium 69-20]
MLILLPPSETKAPGGRGPALDLETLLFPELRHTREALISEVARLSADLPAARAALRVTATKDDEIAANTQLRTAPTIAALNRYTGVLYDALGAGAMSRAERARAEARIVVISALFGAVRAADPIPAYRLSAGSTLPRLGGIAAWWRPALTPWLRRLDAPVLDLRSGAYAAFGRIPGAITVRVVTERPDGTRQVVSHFNKATKGRLARIVATSRAKVATAHDVVRLACRSGMRALQTGDDALEVVT